MTNEELSKKILSEIPKEVLDEMHQNGSHFFGECNYEFIGFMEAYYHLSFLIPKDWTVIDIGCAYNAQCYLFKEHKKYIAVDLSVPLKDMFCLDNTDCWNISSGKFISDILPTYHLDLDRTFAICNFVPDWNSESPIELVKSNFKNVYTFYPS